MRRKADVAMKPATLLSVDEPASSAAVHVLEFHGVSLAFDDNVVLQDVSFRVARGRLKVLLGPSGAGKTVILKLTLGFLKPDSGSVHVNGQRIDDVFEAQLMRVRTDIGMLFQESALFDSLTVADNVGYRLYEETDMPEEDVRRRIEEVLGFIGLEEYIDQMPSELSGGQRRRVAIARAMAAKPRLLLFDSPTSGLDPITAKTVDAEIIKLRDLLGDTAFRLHPITEGDAIEMIDELKGVRLLRGYRGAPRADERSLRDVLLRVSALLATCPEIHELDMNPVKVFEAGARVLDARVRVEHAASPPRTRRVEY